MKENQLEKLQAKADHSGARELASSSSQALEAGPATCFVETLPSSSRPRGRMMGAEGEGRCPGKPSEALEPGLQAGGTAGPQERPSEPGDLGSKSQPVVSQDDGSERQAVSMLSHTVL